MADKEQAKSKAKGFFGEFREFIMRGNVMDLAVAVIIGGAFQAIINSLVNDIIMPLISLATGGIDFTNWFIGRFKLYDSCSGTGGRCLDAQLWRVYHRDHQFPADGHRDLLSCQDDERYRCQS